MSGRDTRSRSPVGVVLEPAEVQQLQAWLKLWGPLRTAMELGVSAPAAIRAASGLRVLAGTRALIRQALERAQNAEGRSGRAGGGR